MVEKDCQCLDKVTRELTRLRLQRDAYQRAFKQIDDRTEYNPFTRNDFSGIAAVLTQSLKTIEEVYGN